MPTPDDYNNSQPGYRNFNPPPTTPGYFTVANPTGGPPPPGRTTESSTRNGDPRATQTATVPPPPGVPVGTTYPPPPDRPIPPTPDAYKPRAPYTPVPWHQQQPPPADPTPPLGAWTPDQISPWLHPHIQPVRGPVPNREPDSWVGSRPVWNPRPGEQGGGGTRLPPGQAYTFPQMLALAQHVGFQGQAAYTAAAIGMAESSGSPGVIHYNDGGKGYNSYGLMQINGVNDQTLAGLGGARAALDPETSMKAAYVLSKGGSDFSPWSTFNDGAYRNYLDLNARPQESGVQLAGPPQQYIPSQGREPQHWGSEPEHDWTPGRMPQSHDIPNILTGLLPLILAGALGGGGLGMLAAFSGYQNARNKGQTAAASDAKNKWKDALEENTSRLKLELLGAKGIQAEYGDMNSPQAKAALQELAMKFEDQQLMTAVTTGDTGAVDQLFKARDAAFQNLSKTSAATTKAEEQEAEKNANVGAERAPYDGQSGVPDASAPGATPAAAPATGRAAMWPENVPPRGAAPSGGGPAAGVTAPRGGTTSPPAAAPPSSAESPSPEEPPPPAPAAAPGPEAPGVDGQPRPAAGGGQPAPQELPEVGIGGLAPANLPPQLSQRVTGLSPERLDQDARQYLETQKDPYRGGPSGDPLATSRNEAVRRRAAQMQSYIDRVIASTKPGDIEGALQKIDTVDPGLASVARLVDRGDQAPPSGWQLRVPFYQTINKVVTSLDPTWSAARWVTNYRTQVAFSSGTQSTQVASMNRALQHMTVLYDAAKRLPNGTWTDLNGLRNYVNTHLGSDAATNFMEARAAVARELERAFRGGSGAYAEIKADLDNVSSSGSPEQILGYIRTSAELLKGQLDAMADLYQRGTHKATTGDDLLSPEARTSLGRIMKWPIDKVPEGAPPPAELDNTATPPPSNMSGPGPAPVEIPQGWVEQPQQ